jgi:hypothetical protein
LASPWIQALDSVNSPNRQQILAASSAWVAVLLNLIPGVGTGYIYQRRWGAYWITSALSVGWFVLGALQGQDVDPVLMPDVLQRNQLIGLAGFAALSGITAIEAFRAAQRSRSVS